MNMVTAGMKDLNKTDLPSVKPSQQTNGKVSDLDGKPPEETDYANYFCTYSFLYHQRDMLEDHKRTGSYFNAVMQNREQFQGKVVLDVGTGTGILAIFAAKAGARQVYAVEATSMAKHAASLVKANGLADQITVIQGVIETVQLPEKVDIIISEWMGYFLLRESMLDSVLVARDRFLAPGGALYPSHARMFFAPIRSQLAHRRMADFQNSMGGWAEFLQDMNNYYGVEMDCLSREFREEQQEYFLNTSAWADINPRQMLGPAVCIKEFDLLTVSQQEIAAPVEASFTLNVLEHGPVEGFVGFFDTQFKGSPEQPASYPTLLSTAPDPTGATHWGQQSFTVHPPIDCMPGDSIQCTIHIVRKKENHRLMEVELHHQVTGRSSAAVNAPKRVSKYHIE